MVWEILLTEAEVRVLGCLIEKKIATPDYYPLSLNALQNACNQSSNRGPVVSYDEKTVLAAVEGLRAKGLAMETRIGRVPKYEERLIHSRNLVPKETAVLCILMLRGFQTIGELRGRTERLYRFETLEEVQKTLTDLDEWGYVKLLPRQPGRKESRYAHLFSGIPDETETGGSEHPESPVEPDRVALLEEEVRTLRDEFTALRQAFLDFKGQF
jgi:hypothetical protein